MRLKVEDGDWNYPRQTSRSHFLKETTNNTTAAARKTPPNKRFNELRTMAQYAAL